MLILRRILFYHFFPALIGVFILYFTLKTDSFESDSVSLPGSVKKVNHGTILSQGNTNSQLALSVSLKQRIPILLGSSELSASHLEALSNNFFTRYDSSGKFFSLGHEGFQSFAMMTVLAANRPLLKNAKITIILSPGWFEKQYCSGTSLHSFFEYVDPAYLYSIYKDSLLDSGTKKHLYNYLTYNFDKISKPDALIRLMGKKQNYFLNDLVNSPFLALDKLELKHQEQVDPSLHLQEIILMSLEKKEPKIYHFAKLNVNWDSLITESMLKFKLISNNNSIAVENEYYTAWLKNKPLKNLIAVNGKSNQEFQDFLALVNFLKVNNCEPLFVIMPLNKKAHKDLNVLMPIVTSIKVELEKKHFKLLDMYSPNVISYQEGILEDIMHPYNAGWYQIDKFIYENQHD